MQSSKTHHVKHNIYFCDSSPESSPTYSIELTSDSAICQVCVGGGNYATFDACDRPLIEGKRWYVVRSGRNKYAQCRAESLYMHRAIMQPGAGQWVDHINGNGLDNRRCNLRLCTPSQNHAAKRPWGRLRYRGVSKLHKKWRAAICVDGKREHLGSFDDPRDAAKAYDRRAVEIFGEFARLNFPELAVTALASPSLPPSSPACQGTFTPTPAGATPVCPPTHKAPAGALTSARPGRA